MSIAKLRNVEIEDLLGRDPIRVNLDEIMGYVSGKVVLVTGGGGSIGSELCRQVASHNPKQLIIFDIYENNAYDIQLELKEKYPDLDLVVLIGSVRNTHRIETVFEKYRPDIVYHAAAHKHVPLMEDSPNEAIKNNVFGTYKTAKAADKYGTSRFVLISTDKAVNPTNIMGVLHKPDESVALEDLVIRGGRFSLLQERDYWQYETYVERFRPDTVGREAAFNRFVKFPYPEDARLDSLIEGRSTVTYYYSQEVKTDETSKKMLVTLQGQVLAVDDSAYRLPPSDTLSYVVSSMLSFVDTVPRYRIKVIDKFVTVEDRNYIQFFVGDTRVVDTLGDNRRQLDKITGLMRQIVEQQEFYVDTITLTAASSPEGAYAFNDRLSQGRAAALKRYLVRRYGRSIDTMLTVRWVAEDWTELTNRIRTDREIVNRDAILELIAEEKNPDRREQAIRQQFSKEYAYIRSVIYPQLRAVNFRYNLRRKGMVKDTIHTTELDTAYARGVELLRKRKYAKALYILNDYNDRNTVVAHLSLDHNERAMELLAAMPEDAATEYLRAIACSRLGRKEEGRRHFLEACRLDERMEYRGNLDPEIAELLKQ